MEKLKTNRKSFLRGMVHRRWFWVAMTGLALLGLVLLFLPYGIDYGVEHWLLSHGAELASVGDIDFNPFTGRLVVHNLQITGANERAMQIGEATLDIDWSPLWRKRGYAEKLTVRNTSITVDHSADGRWRVGGLLFAAAQAVTTTPDKSAWGFSLDQLEATNTRIHHVNRGIDLSLQIDHAKMTKLVSWDKKNETRLELEGRVNDGRLRLQATFFPFATEPNFTGDVDLSGLSLAAFAKLVSPRLTGLNGKLHIKGKLDGVQPKNALLRLTQQGSIAVKDTGVRAASTEFSAENLTWNGLARLSFPSESAGLKASGKRDAGNPGSETNDAPPELLPEVANTLQSERIKREKPIAAVKLELSGDLGGKGVRVYHSKSEIDILELDAFVLRKVRAKDTRQVDISEVKLKKPILLKRAASLKSSNGNAPLFNAASIILTDVELVEMRDLAINSVEFRDAVTLVRRDSEGKWILIEDLLSAQNKDESAQPAEPRRSSTFRIASMEILGDSRLIFQDHKVSPKYQTELQLGEVRLSNLDNSKSENSAKLKLAAKVDDYAELSMEGEIQPFARRPSLHLACKIEDLSLPRLSSYIDRQIGYRIKNGQLDAEIELGAVEGELNGKAKLLIGNLEVTPSDAAKMERFERQLKVPLPTALSLLRDKNKNIKLKVPVRGDISDPKFDFTDALNQILVKAMQKSALSYLKYIFQPYGTMITVVELGYAGGKKLTAVRLDPVIFEPGSERFSDTAFDYLGRVAQLMKTRPKLRIKLCGKVTSADVKGHGEKSNPLVEKQAEKELSSAKEADSAKAEIPSEQRMPAAVDEELLELARQRSLVIKKHLVKDHAIDDDRLFLCYPEYDGGENAAPRVELLI